MRSDEDYAITIDNASSAWSGSQEIKFEAVELKLQVLNTTLLPNGLPSSCNAQFTGGSISVKGSSVSFTPVGNTVQIQYTYGE